LGVSLAHKINLVLEHVNPSLSRRVFVFDGLEFFKNSHNILSLPQFGPLLSFNPIAIEITADKCFFTKLD